MDEWIPLDEARARLGLHPDTLRRQIRRGEREAGQRRQIEELQAWWRRFVYGEG